MELRIEDCLTSQNKHFYEDKVQGRLIIRLLSSGDDDLFWGVQYRQHLNEAIIYVGKDFPNVESFTHEILHLYLMINGFDLKIINTIENYSHLNSTLVDTKKQDLFVEIGNHISHYKMLPLFTDGLGFEKSKFMAKWERSITDDNFLSFKNGYGDPEKYKLNFINFIIIFFDTRYHFQDELIEDYKRYSFELEGLDPFLYKGLNEACMKWDKSESFDNKAFYTALYHHLEVCLKRANKSKVRRFLSMLLCMKNVGTKKEGLLS